MSASDYVKQLHAEIEEQALDQPVRTASRRRRQTLLRVRYR